MRELVVAAALVLAAIATPLRWGGAQPPAPATDMAGSMTEHPARPFYREGTFHALVGIGTAAALLVGYRVLRARWRRRAAPAGFVSEAVLAVDLMDSTHLATHYGEAVALRARNALEEQVRRLTEATRAFLETTGDGCLVTFPAVTPALESAVALVRERYERPIDLGPAGRLEVRVGVTYGEILLDARGVRHGTAINKAYRLLSVKAKDLAELKGDAEGTGLSERTRILVDEDAAQEVGRTVGLRFVGYARLRGFTGLHGLYEAKWQAGSQPTQPGGAARAADPQGRASGQHGGMQ